MQRIAVLMTCFNRVQTTLECLRRLFAQELPDGYVLDVWLVDDASPDGTGEKVKVAYPQVNVIQGPGNLFWCKGMRLAWDKAAEHADYDFYLWLNDDVLLIPGALSRIFADYDNLSDIGLRVMVGAFWESEQKKMISYSAGGLDGRDICPNGAAPIRGNGWFGGNLVLVPADVVCKVGKISGFYHHGYGDFDYARRLQRFHIPFYVGSVVAGYCSKEDKPICKLASMSLWRRMRKLWEPNSYHLGDVFVYRYRHDGFLRALVSVIHVSLIVILGIGGKR